MLDTVRAFFFKPFPGFLLATALTVAAILPKQVQADCVDYPDYVHGIGGLELSDIVYQTVVAGNLAFLATGSTGLRVVDISDPASPLTLSGIDTPGDALGLALAGDRAFVADGDSGLQVVDISNPLTPSLAGHLALPAAAKDVAVSGNYLCVADGDSGLQIVDVSDPSAPARLGCVDTLYVATHVAVKDGFAYVASYTGLAIVDISDPSAPQVVSHLYGHVLTVTLAGNLALLGTLGYLQIVDISNPASPAVLGSIKAGTTWVNSIAVAGDVAYVLDRTFSMIDISDPAHPVWLGGINPRGVANHLALNGNVAYLGEGLPNSSRWRGLEVVDISNPMSPVRLSQYLGSVGGPGGLAGEGNALYMVFGNRFSVIDLSNPASPRLLNDDLTVGGVQMAASGHRVYLAEGTAGLKIIDASNPQSPAVLGSIDTPGGASGVAVTGNVAYVADGLSGLQIIDVSTPASPTILGTADTPDFAGSVAISAHFAYVADDDSGLVVIDVANPTDPLITGRLDLVHASSVVVSGDVGYVLTSPGLLYVLALTDPSSPEIRSSIDVYSSSARLDVAGNVAYVTWNGLGFEVIDVSDPAAPRFLGGAVSETHYNYPGWDIAVVNGNICLSMASGLGPNELLVYPIQCPVPTSVAIQTFNATSTPEGIALEWIASEVGDLAGYHIHRWTDSEHVSRRLTPTLLLPRGSHHFLDTDVDPGITYSYRLEAVDRAGGRSFFGPVTARMGDAQLRSLLGASRPNPFGGNAASTVMAFYLEKREPVRFTIYDLSGRLVRLLIDTTLDRGPHEIAWDGRDGHGQSTGPGTYFYRLETQVASWSRPVVRLN